MECGGTLRVLLERNLIRILGKKEEPGRPLLYGTTKGFLEVFQLRSLAELPILFLLSLSPEFAEERHRRFEHWRGRYARRFQKIRLRPLDAQRSRELVDLVAGETTLPEDGFWTEGCHEDGASGGAAFQPGGAVGGNRNR